MITERIKKFIRMYRQNGIFINIVKQLPGIILVDVSQESSQLNNRELVKRAEDLFKGELPENMKVIVQPVKHNPSKYFFYEISGKRYVQRVIAPEFTLEVKSGKSEDAYNFDYRGNPFHLIGLDDQKQLKNASKWLCNYSNLFKRLYYGD